MSSPRELDQWIQSKSGDAPPVSDETEEKEPETDSSWKVSPRHSIRDSARRIKHSAESTYIASESQQVQAQLESEDPAFYNRPQRGEKNAAPMPDVFSVVCPHCTYENHQEFSEMCDVCQMCGLPPSDIIDNSAVRQHEDVDLPLSPFKAMSNIIRTVHGAQCTRKRPVQLRPDAMMDNIIAKDSLGADWECLTTSHNGLGCYLDTSDGLGFLGWIQTLDEVHSHKVCAGYLECALNGRGEHIEKDRTTQLRRKLFKLAMEVKMSFPDEPVLQPQGSRMGDICATAFRTAADPNFLLKKDLIKTSIILAEMRRPGTHDELWCAWLAGREADAILSKVESELSFVGLTEDVLKLEIAME